jgi:hypothetical protein
LESNRNEFVLNKIENHWIKFESCSTELHESLLAGDEGHHQPFIYKEADKKSTKVGFNPALGWEEHQVCIQQKEIGF